MNSKNVFNEIRKIYNNLSDIEEIGNHHLKRHLVYSFVSDDKKYVLKIFYKKNRWNREVHALKALRTTMKVPNLLHYGIIADGTEWLIYDYINGDLLLDIYDRVSHDELIRIYYLAGVELKKLHQYKDYDFFGSVDIDGQSLEGFTSFEARMRNEMDKYKCDIYSEVHDDIDLINKGLEALEPLYKVIDCSIQPVLCHNDYSKRNFLVTKTDNHYTLASVIDFEQCLPSYKTKEISEVYFSLLEESKDYANSFLKGYGGYNIQYLEDYKTFMLLYRGLGIISWCQSVDLNYYNEGIKMIKDALKRIDKNM